MSVNDHQMCQNIFRQTISTRHIEKTKATAIKQVNNTENVYSFDC